MKPHLYRIGAITLVLLTMLLGVCLLRSAKATEQKTVLLNLTQPIEANKSSSATAKFTELTQEAMKYGMAEATINGQVEYSMQPDKTIRSNIKWSSISIENGGKKVTEGLESSLSSMFRVPESSPRAEPGTKLKAVGDVEALATALGKLKAQLDAQNVVVQKENTSSKTQSQAVAPTVQAQDQGNQGKYLSDAGNPFNTVVEAGTVTTYTACDARFVDTASMKAVKQYMPVYTKAGVQTGEGVCTANYSEFAPILSKDGDCTYRFDFNNSTAIKQQQLYYMEGTTEVLVGTCQDSNVIYPLYESRTGCSVVTDLANKKVFPQSKLAFKVGALEQNATMCRAVSGTTGIPILEEACDPMWEHDFTNHVSYLVTKLYYLSDVDGSKIYVNTCGRSSTVSFPHVTDVSNCTQWLNDDAHMLAYQQGKTIIRTGTLAGDVVVQDCHTIATLNYTYIGTQKMIGTYGPGTASFTVPGGVTSAHWLLSAGGNGTPQACLGAFSYMAPGKTGQAKVQYDFPVAPGGTFTFTVGSYNQASTMTYTETGKANQTWNMAKSTDPDWVLGTFNCSGRGNGTPGICTTCPAGVGTMAETKGLDGLIVTGYFGLNSAADNPHGGTSGPSMYNAGGASMPGGIGFGASGAGPYQGQWDGSCAGGVGTLGAFLLEYNVQKYMRPDATTYTRN